jgi:hypothetical protein
MPTRKPKAVSKPKPYIANIDKLGIIIFLERTGKDREPADHTEGHIDDFLSFYWDQQNPVIVGVKITMFSRLTREDWIRDLGSYSQIPFKRVISSALRIMNSQNLDALREHHLRGQLYEIAERIVGESMIPRRVWRKMLRDIGA